MAQAGRTSPRSLLGLVALLTLVWGGSQWLDHWRDARAASAIREHSQRVGITLYTTSTCPYCARAIAWLQRHEVRWHECNVETNADCQRTYEQQGSPGVPLVLAGERWHLGFHVPWLAEVLAAQDDRGGALIHAPASGEAPSVVMPSQSTSPSEARSPRP